MPEPNRARRSLRTACRELLSLPCPEDPQDPLALLEAARGAGLTVDLYAAAFLGQVAKAAQGNASAFTALRDAAGDKVSEAAQEGESFSAADLMLLRRVALRLGEEDEGDGEASPAKQARPRRARAAGSEEKGGENTTKVKKTVRKKTEAKPAARRVKAAGKQAETAEKEKQP